MLIVSQPRKFMSLASSYVFSPRFFAPFRHVQPQIALSSTPMLWTRKRPPPEPSAHAEEQEEAARAAADEVTPLAPKRCRHRRDGYSVTSLKKRLRHLGAKTTGNKADLLDRLCGLVAEAPDPSAHAEEQEEAARAHVLCYGLAASAL